MLALPAAKGSIKKISSSSLVKTDSSSALSTPFKLNKKRISVVSTTLKLQEKQKQKVYKEQKKEAFKAADKGEKISTEKLLEAEPEKKLKPKLKADAPTIKTPGFFDRIFKFVLYTALGWLIDKIGDQNSIVNKIFTTIGDLLGSFIEWFPKFLDATFKFFEIVGPPLLKFGGMLFDGITGAIDLGYSTYEKIRGNVSTNQGEEAAKKLDGFVDGINKFIDSALIFGTAMLMFGDDLIPDLSGPDRPSGPSGPSGQVKPGSKPSTQQKLKNARIRDIQRQYGPGARKIYENALNNGKSPKQAEAAVKRGFKKGVAFRPGADSLAARTAPKGSIFKGFGKQGLKKGIDKATQRFFLKIVGMGGVKVLKGILSKIPVIGPLITFALNWASGESIARSGAMAVGSGLGQMLGTWAGGALGALGGPLAPITVPLGGFLGNVLGSLGGELLGGFLFDLVTGKKGKPGQVFSSAIATIRKFFEKDFQNVVKGFLSWIGNTLVSGAKGLWNALTAMAKFIGGLDFFKALGKATNNIRYSLKKLWEKKGDIFNPLKIIGYIGTIRSVLGELFKIMVFPGLGKFLLDNAVVPFFNSIGNLWKNKDKLFNFLTSSAKNVGSFVMKEGTFQDITGGPDLSLSEGIENFNIGGVVNPVPSQKISSNKGGYAADTGLDILTPVGSKVVSSVDGILEYAEKGHVAQMGQDANPNMAGHQDQHSVRIKLDKPFSYKGKKVNFFYATHLYELDSRVKDKKGIKITAGTPLGLSGVANKVPHIHVGYVEDRAQTKFLNYLDVRSLLSGAPSTESGDLVTTPSDVVTGPKEGGYMSPIMALANLMEELLGQPSKTKMGESGPEKLDPEYKQKVTPTETLTTISKPRDTQLTETQRPSFSGVPSKSTSGLSDLAQMLSYNEPEPNTQLIFVTKETYIK